MQVPYSGNRDVTQLPFDSLGVFCRITCFLPYLHEVAYSHGGR